MNFVADDIPAGNHRAPSDGHKAGTSRGLVNPSGNYQAHHWLSAREYIICDGTSSVRPSVLPSGKGEGVRSETRGWII